MTTMHSLKAGILNLWRNKFLSIATILVIAILVFIFNIILTIHFVAQGKLSELSQKIDIVLYLQVNIDESTSKEIVENIKKIDGVRSTEYISKEEALRQFLQAHPQTEEYFKRFELENTLPPSIHIQVKTPEYYERIQEKLKQSDYKNLITNFSEGGGEKNITQAIIDNLNKTTKFTRYLMYWLIITFLIGGVLMIHNAIRLTIHTRRLEVSIMKLVGADASTIHLPYIFEGILYSIIALAGSFLLFWIVSSGALLKELFAFSGEVEIPFTTIFIIESALTIILATTSSMLAISKYTKEKLLG